MKLINNKIRINALILGVTTLIATFGILPRIKNESLASENPLETTEPTETMALEVTVSGEMFAKVATEESSVRIITPTPIETTTPTTSETTTVPTTSQTTLKPTTPTTKTTTKSTTQKPTTKATTTPTTVKNAVDYLPELKEYMGLSYYVESNKARYLAYKSLNPTYGFEKVITYVNIGLDYPFYTNIRTVVNQGATNILVNKYNKISSTFSPAISLIDSNYSSKTLYCATVAKDAFINMCKAAESEGIRLFAISAYRTYSYQNTSYINQVSNKGQAYADISVARAGHSEHNTGLAIDVVNSSATANFQNTATYAWLKKNAHKYGFIERYPSGKTSITGYMFEPWHWRYLGPELANAVRNSGLTYDEYSARHIDPERKLEANDYSRTRVLV